MESAGATRVTSLMPGNSHRVIGSATKWAVACPRPSQGNAVVLPLSDSGKRRASGAFQIMGYCG